MRLIGQEVDALAEHQLNEFAGERLLTGLALKCRSRPEADLGRIAVSFWSRLVAAVHLRGNNGCCYRKQSLP